MRTTQKVFKRLDKKILRARRVEIPAVRTTFKPTEVHIARKNYQRYVKNIELSSTNYRSSLNHRNLFPREAICANDLCRKNGSIRTCGGVAAHVAFRKKEEGRRMVGLVLTCQSCNMGPRKMKLRKGTEIIQLAEVQTKYVSKLYDEGDVILRRSVYC